MKRLKGIPRRGAKLRNTYLMFSCVNDSLVNCLSSYGSHVTAVGCSDERTAVDPIKNVIVVLGSTDFSVFETVLDSLYVIKL